jgi:hypothetical protein
VPKLVAKLVDETNNLRLIYLKRWSAKDRAQHDRKNLSIAHAGIGERTPV